jgi:hypothetical protein
MKESKLVAGITVQIHKDLKAVMIPLAERGVIPTRRPLHSFWLRALDALEVIDPSCQLS